MWGFYCNLLGHFLVQIRTLTTTHLSLNTLIFWTNVFTSRFTICYLTPMIFLPFSSFMVSSPKKLTGHTSPWQPLLCCSILLPFLAQVWAQVSSLVYCLLTLTKSQPCRSFQTLLGPQGSGHVGMPAVLQWHERQRWWLLPSSWDWWSVPTESQNRLV